MVVARRVVRNHQHQRAHVRRTQRAHQLAAGLGHPNPYVREYAAELLRRRAVGSEEVKLALLRAIEKPHPKEVDCGGLKFGSLTTSRLTLFLEWKTPNLSSISM